MMPEMQVDSRAAADAADVVDGMVAPGLTALNCCPAGGRVSEQFQDHDANVCRGCLADLTYCTCQRGGPNVALVIPRRTARFHDPGTPLGDEREEYRGADA